LAVAVFAAGSAAVVAVVLDGDGAADSDGELIRTGGPLAGPGNASATSAPVPLGKPYSWGGTTLVNKGDEAVTIERVELLEVPEGMRVIGMYALPGGESGIGLGKGYDPTGPQFSGLTIKPDNSYDVVVGLEITKPGAFTIPGTRVHYRVGTERHQAILSHGIRLCGPPEEYKRCSLRAKVYDG
jgi:hypothetical protein